MEKGEKKIRYPFASIFSKIIKVIQYYFFPTRRQFLNQWEHMELLGGFKYILAVSRESSLLV